MKLNQQQYWLKRWCTEDFTAKKTCSRLPKSLTKTYKFVELNKIIKNFGLRRDELKEPYLHLPEGGKSKILKY